MTRRRRITSITMSRSEEDNDAKGSNMRECTEFNVRLLAH